MKPRPNVVFASCDWKESFQDSDYCLLKKGYVGKGEFYFRNVPDVDANILVYAPPGFDAWLDVVKRTTDARGLTRKILGNNTTDLFDYGDCFGDDAGLQDRKFSGLFWDGKDLFALYDGTFFPWDIWTDINVPE